MINNKHKKGSYAELLQRLHKGEDGLKSILQVFNYENAAAFEKDWYYYMKTSKFK